MTQADAELLEVLRKVERDSLAWSLDQLHPGKGAQRLMFLNAHGVNCAAENTGFRQQVLHSEFLLRDGVGLAKGMQRLGLQETENLNGTDLIPKVLAHHRSARLAVWGSSEEALEKLGVRLREDGHDALVSLEHGFHEDAFYVEKYRTLQPDILVLCMGMPRQELLAGKLLSDKGDGLIICGGGWANFHSGHIPRAPLWVQRMRLEWLHRLSREPLRLGRRYTIDIVRYFMHIRRLSQRA
ncbi:WecB/TagA/CpsF family glycosyltransferase [uncultured Tateyamaria sp.]|uniref:WecB/TagA/CpsF family glycosyltransferase n=1 Tax=uncultured Tateyamaria sp. TaxID=455651 RepID=UPI0026188287|nr:WecB/TagA/CpsF family glycosyltransferase [uncultured Tateyamaria sp.]